jgi:hypothetical protein
MKLEKRVAILVSIALILAIVAISLNLGDGSDVGTNAPENGGNGPTGAIVGLIIGDPGASVDDKGNEPAGGDI